MTKPASKRTETTPDGPWRIEWDDCTMLFDVVDLRGDLIGSFLDRSNAELFVSALEAQQKKDLTSA